METTFYDFLDEEPEENVPKPSKPVKSSGCLIC